MGYPKDLNEYTDLEIEHEYKRRFASAQANICAYCSYPYEFCHCKMKINSGLQMAKGVADYPFTPGIIVYGR